jgi:4-aminobutyrate aminotransferase
VQAIQQQAGRLLHMSSTDFYNQPQCDLAVKLANIAQGDAPKRVFFTNSGAEAIEAAMKLVRFHTNRKRIIAFTGAFHGRTMGALSLTASKATQRRGFGPLVPEIAHVSYPNPYRHGEGSVDATLRQLETLFRTTAPPEEVAAIFVEPIQGEGGYIVPPADFHRRLKALAEEHGILYVADEVQTGMGRTGKMFALEHFGIVPDIVCLAKGIASGMPLGAIVASGEIMNWPPGSHASTYGGNPVACAAALETIHLLEESLIDNAARQGALLMEKLRELQSRHALIGDVRGMGLMVGAELVRDRQKKTPAPEERNAVVQACFQRGLLMLGCGESTLRFCPPLVAEAEHIEAAVEILDAALAEVSGSPNPLDAHVHS